MAEVTEHLPSKLKALSPNSYPPQKKKKKKKNPKPKGGGDDSSGRVICLECTRPTVQPQHHNNNQIWKESILIRNGSLPRVKAKIKELPIQGRYFL
jgi:hypothetical protein